jgi:hypothetical protein
VLIEGVLQEFAELDVVVDDEHADTRGRTLHLAGLDVGAGHRDPPSPWRALHGGPALSLSTPA